MKKLLITTLVLSFAIFGFQGVTSAAPVNGGFQTQELPFQH